MRCEIRIACNVVAKDFKNPTHIGTYSQNKNWLLERGHYFHFLLKDSSAKLSLKTKSEN